MTKIHYLTIDPRRCRGLHLCHQCEILQPGLVQACERQGHVTIQEWALSEQGAAMSALIEACPERAIMIQPAKEEVPDA